MRERRLVLELYLLTKDAAWFHESIRRLIKLILIPVIRNVFIFSGAVRVHERHSIHESYSFNTFMSDIDLSVVSLEEKFSFLYEVSRWLKFIIPNLGEIEFFTPEEWQTMELLYSDSHSKQWMILFNIRKISWMKEELRRNPGRYQKHKLERGIANSFQKLGVSNYPIYPESLLILEDFQEGRFPYFSKFLNHTITIDGKGDVLSFASGKKASAFMALLPDSPIPLKNNPVKKYFLQREMYLTLVSLRLDRLKGKAELIKEKENWIRDLRTKISFFEK